MNKEGFWQIEFRGERDHGVGVLVLDTLMVVGTDTTGVTYDGFYEYNPRTDKLDMALTLTVPPGVSLGQGHPAQDRETRMEINCSLPRDLGHETPVPVDTPTGLVNVVFKKIRDFPD